MSLQNIILFYGGKSEEHEISCRSARLVVEHLDPKRFSLCPIGISKSGVMWPQNWQRLRESHQEQLPIYQDPPQKPMTDLVGYLMDNGYGECGSTTPPVVFSVLHGRGGEDGSFQGYLQTLGLNFVGTEAAASAVSFNKLLTKQCVNAAGLATAPQLVARRSDWQQQPWADRIDSELGYPVFIKPATGGSSMGVHRIAGPDSDSLMTALADAFQYDATVLIEAAIAGREIEFAALQDHQGDPSSINISVPSEIATKTGHWYDYQAKYQDPSGELSKVIIPAPNMSPALVEKGQKLARQAFEALNLRGYARLDFFLTPDHRYIFNEANTLPGFTSQSQFPMVWHHAGISNRQLLERLIDSARPGESV